MSTPADTNPPIVIQGGSVTIEFDPTIFPPNGNNKHSNANKKIKSVEVSVNGGAPTTFDTPNGKVTVTVHYDNSNK